MLARPERHRCIECGRPTSDPDFMMHYGRVEHGPAYWSDRGILCSAACSLEHTKRRMADGTLPTEPSENPLERDVFVRR